MFAFDAATCRRAVFYFRDGIPNVPIWLLSTAVPEPDVPQQCERVFVHTSQAALLMQAERVLWQRWVVLAAAPWTGQGGHWLLKLAPLLVPPCRALFMNEQGDFFPGKPRTIAGSLPLACATIRGSCARPFGGCHGVRRGSIIRGFAGCGRLPPRLVRPAAPQALPLCAPE